MIDRKQGIPITLSIVFLHVAAKMGLKAHGVGLPGHYIVKVQFELNELFVDPFHGGESLTMPEIAVLVRQTSGDLVARMITGHATVAMTEHYSLVDADERAEALRKAFGAALGANGASGTGPTAPSDERKTPQA